LRVYVFQSRSIKKIIGTVGITVTDRSLQYGHLVQKLAELFVREKSLRESSFLRESAISNLVAQVIDKNNQSCNKSYILSQAKSLNYDLNRPKIAIIVDILHFEKIIDDIQSLISEYKNSEIKIQLLKGFSIKIFKRFI
jgi:sugar diacid utilization regulator